MSVPDIDIVPMALRNLSTKERWLQITAGNRKQWLERFATKPVAEWSQMTMEIFASYKCVEPVKRRSFKHDGLECHLRDFVTAVDRHGTVIEGVVERLYNDKVFVLEDGAKRPIMVGAVDVTSVEAASKRKKRKKDAEKKTDAVPFPKIWDTVWFKFQKDGGTFKGVVKYVNNPTVTVQCDDSMAPTKIHKSMIHRVVKPTAAVDDEDLFGDDQTSEREDSF